MTTTTTGGPGLDDVFSSTVRLRICAYLSGCEEADFKAVQEYCGSPSRPCRRTSPSSPTRATSPSEGRLGSVHDDPTAVDDDGRAALDGHVAALQAIVGQAKAQHEG